MGGVCEEINASWDAESRAVWIVSSGEKWERGERVYVRRSTPGGDTENKDECIVSGKGMGVS